MAIGDEHRTAEVTLKAGRQEMGRRAFLAGSLGAAAWVGSGCSNEGGAGPVASSARPGGPSPDRPAFATTDDMMGWIEQIVGRGIRRPGYEADIWTERFVADRFRALGLVDVHVEPVDLTRWEPHRWKLVATPTGGPSRELACYPVPYAAPTDGTDLELVPFDDGDPQAVTGHAALVDVPPLRLPADAAAALGSAPSDLAGRIYDPDRTLAGETQVLPHTAMRNDVVVPAEAAGAAAFIGALVDHPGDVRRYFVPYNGKAISIPGAWVSASDSEWLHDRLREGAVRVRLEVSSSAAPFRSHNVVADLPGADDEVVLIGSHHDGPWASAVEDGSGIALVLAQAAHWAWRPAVERPHRLRFLLHAGHMCGGAGHRRYVIDHADELDRIVLEVHLEHAARDVAARGGRLELTGRCVPRWFFTSRNPTLERAVSRAIVAEDLRRSMVVAPDALGANPPTDGAAFHRLGVPIVQLLTAPWYLFDEVDHLDKVDRDNILPISRAVAAVIESSRETSAAEMRAGIVST